jgi:hypothetical protein
MAQSYTHAHTYASARHGLQWMPWTPCVGWREHGYDKACLVCLSLRPSGWDFTFSVKLPLLTGGFWVTYLADADGDVGRWVGVCVCVCVCVREREREVWWDDDGRVMLHIRWCMHTWYIPTVCAYGSLSIVVGRYGLCMLYAPLCADRYCRMGNVSRYSVDLGFLRWWRLLGIW